MMKLLRKYNKQLLAIFMAFLMIVFIGGSAIYEIFTPDPNMLVAESDLGSIKTYDVREIKATTSILSNLNYPWQMLGGLNNEPLNAIDWLLLNRETEKLGTALSPADARAQLNHNTPADQWERNAFRMRVKPRDIYKAAAQFGSVQQTLTSMYAAAEPSMAEVRTAARNALDKVKVQTIMIPAEVIVGEQLAGSDESLKELWEQYRATERGRGLNFGYYQAPSVNVEYIRVDPAKIAETISVPNLESRAREFAESNPRHAALRKPANLEEVETEEGEVAPPSPYYTWGDPEGKDAARGVIKEREARRLAKEIVGALIDYAQAPFLENERNIDTGYRPAPEEAKTADYYQSLIERLPDRYSFPDAIEIGRTGFFSVENAAEAPDIGGARVVGPDGRARGQLSNYVSQIEPLVPNLEEIETMGSVVYDDYLALYETSLYSLVKGADEEFFLYRVVDFKPGHPSESFEEVRDQVVEDYKLLKAYEELEMLAGQLVYEAFDQDLSRPWIENEQLRYYVEELPEGDKIRFIEPAPISRNRKNAFEAARGRPDNGVMVGDLGITFSNEDVDRLFELEFMEDKAIVIENKEEATIVIAQWLETIKGTETEFNEMRPQILRNMRANRQREIRSNWLDPEQIRARTGYKTVVQ